MVSGHLVLTADITWMSNIKHVHVPMVTFGATLLFFKVMGLAYVCTYRHPCDNQNFFDRLVTDLLRYSMGSTRAPLVHRRSAKTALDL